MIDSRMLFKIKHLAIGTHGKVQGQIYGEIILLEKEINYTDTFSPIARRTPNRVFMCFPLIFGWPLFLYNVRLLYLNGMI